MTDERAWLRLFVQPPTPWTQMSEATKDAWLRDLARALRRSTRERAVETLRTSAPVSPSPGGGSVRSG